MGRWLLAALAACFLTTSWADEKAPADAGEKPEAGAARKTAGGRARRREGGAPSKGKAGGEAAPEKQKPCEVVRPCPID